MSNAVLHYVEEWTPERIDALPPQILDLGASTFMNYTNMRLLPDGRIIGVLRLLFHWTMHVDIDYVGYNDRYCFLTYSLAKQAFLDWNGQGDPEGWHRHPTTGRRVNPETGEIYVSF